jgi:broad specificity phosphatase PhoE
VGTIVLVRHGESVANRDRHFAEGGENPLTELGLRQARELAPIVAARFHPPVVLSSEFLRAKQTASILAEHLNVPLEVIEGIHERDFGSLKGLPYQHYWDMKKNDPAYDPKRDWIWEPPDGESREAVRARVIASLKIVAQRFPHQELVVVCHGVVISSVFAHVTGNWEEAPIPANCGMALLEHEGGEFLRVEVVDGCSVIPSSQLESEAAVSLRRQSQ